MKQKSDIERGWEFASRATASTIGAGIGVQYLSDIDVFITNFEQTLVGLKSNQSDAVLGGFVAEYWHAGTFTLDAMASGSKHKAWVEEGLRHEKFSPDIGTNFGKKYSSKYYATAEKSAVEQSIYSNDIGEAGYHGQERLVPSDQHEKVIEVAGKRAKSNAETRPEVSKAYGETAEHATKTVSDGKSSSKELTKAESEEIAKEIKKDEFSAEEHGVTTDNAIKAEYIVKGAVKAGLSTAMITMAIQLAPDIYKAIDYLIKHKELDVQQLKAMGKKAISSAAEGFLRGSVSFSLVTLCKAGKFGAAFKSADPMMIASTVAIVLETIKNGIAVANGKMTAREMGGAFVDSVVTTVGFVAGMQIGAQIGGAIGQAIGFQLPILGYIIGSLVGCAFSVAYNYGKKKLISFCVDTGFTCFGLVEQDYTLPPEILEEMGVDIIPIQRTEVSRTNVQTIQLDTGIGRTNYETIDIKLVRRGVIGVNKVGYVY